MFFLQTHDDAGTDLLTVARVHVAVLVRVLLALVVLALLTALVVAVRVFVFEYFHGDPQPLHNLYGLIAGRLNH